MTDPSPDIEALLVAYLLAAPAVTAIAGDRVGTRTPTSTAQAWLRVRLLDDAPGRSRSLRLLNALVQLDCYAGEDRAGAQEDAADLARAARAALNDMPNAAHDGAVVTAVIFSGLRPMPDSDFKPARERYLLDATVYFHAA